MPARSRSNPLALAVLVCLAERPMHPYEAASTLRQREAIGSWFGSKLGCVARCRRRRSFGFAPSSMEPELWPDSKSIRTVVGT